MRQLRTAGNTLTQARGEEQKLACPLCGELKTLRGLHGHLRIKHHKQKEEIMELVSHAPIDPTGNVEEVLNLLDLLKSLNERHEQLEILEARNCFETDEVRAALFEKIRGEAGGIVNRLSERGVILEGSDIAAYCGTAVPEEEEQGE